MENGGYAQGLTRTITMEYAVEFSAATPGGWGPQSIMVHLKPNLGLPKVF